MWEAISNVLNGENVFPVLFFLIFLILIFLLLIKTGVLSIRTNVIRIGSNEHERTIIRQQIEWTKLYCKGLEAKIPHPEGYNKWRGLYISERIFDEIVTWITFNHISLNEDYVEIKQTRIINLVNSLTEKDEFRTEEFQEQIRREMKFVINKLIQIRKLYD